MAFAHQTLNHQYDNSLVSNAFGFLRLPLNFEPYQSDAQAVITGVPFDLAVSGRSGTRYGPEAMRRISMQLAWEHCRFPWTFCLTDKLKVCDCGDLVYDFGDPHSFERNLTAHIGKLAAACKIPLCLGGDHFITLPILRGLQPQHGPMALVHFDAHSDTYAQGSQCDHGTMFHRAPEEGLIDKSHSIQIGIRTEYDARDGFLVLPAPVANDLSPAEIAQQIIERCGDMPCYLSFDIDCLDPAYAPGTGTPVMGGLSSDRILKVLRALGRLNLVGMDVVEVSPPYDHSDITALAGATIALEMLYLLASKQAD